MSLIPPDSTSTCHAQNETGCLESSAPFLCSIFSLPRLAAILLAQAQTSLLQNLPTTSLIGMLREAPWGHPALPPSKPPYKKLCKNRKQELGILEDLWWYARKKETGGLKWNSDRTHWGLNVAGNNENTASPPVLDTFNLQMQRTFRNTFQDKINPITLLAVHSYSTFQKY